MSAALADRYTLQRELGRGGMATVYLATDLKHERPVALKVLRHELAAVLGPDRFLREIKLTAALDHPHILALLDSGTADGQLFYVMPYVEGESLRDRLNREKQLPLEDALQIAGEVADALGYAHGRGIIHRDIKPENVLLSGGHARVADFGIAKAVSAAGTTTLTETGLVVGTPAYMSPEQAAGNGELDGRSDLYSLGCVLYEMLSGETPYTGSTPMAILAQKLSEPVPRVSVTRETVPAAVEAALLRVMAMKPADRFATAAAFIEALRLPAAPGALESPVRRHTWRRAARWAAVATSVFALGGWGAREVFQTGRAGTLIGEGTLDRGALLLLTHFENRADDSSLAYAVEEALRAALADLKVARVVDPATVSDGLARMGRPRTTRVDETVARELAEREHAQAYVTGEVSRLGTGYQLAARIHSAADGRVLMMERVTARGGDAVVGAVDRLAGRVRRRIGESLRQALARPELARVTTPSLAALRAYTEGIRLWQANKDQAALRFLQEAVAIDSAFASAYRVIGMIHRDYSRVSAAAEAIDRAYRFRDRLPDLERLRVEAAWYVQRQEFDLAEAAYRRLAAPVEPLTSLSDMRLYQHRWAEAESLALRALALDPTNVAAAFNAIEARFAQGRLAAADSVASLTADGAAFFSVWRLFATHDWTALRAGRDSLRREAAWYLDTFLGRLRATETGKGPGLERYDMDAPLTRAFFVLRYRGDTAASRQVIGEYVRRVGWDSLPAAERAYWFLIPLVAELGDTRAARRLLAEWEAATPDSPRLRSDRAWSLGAIALAEGRLDSAAAQFLAWHAAPFAGGQHWTNRGLVEAGVAFDRAGRPDTTIRLFERALAQPAFVQPEYEAQWYPLVLRRLGELYEARREREKALGYYGQFVDLWRDADPELQPQVTAVRERMRRLTEEPR